MSSWADSIAGKIGAGSVGRSGSDFGSDVSVSRDPNAGTFTGAVGGIPLVGGALSGLLGGGDNGQLANGLQGIANQAYRQGDLQRNWLMGQANRAQDYYGNANAQYLNMTGAMTAPGSGEYAFSQHGEDINNLTPIQDYQRLQNAQLQATPGAGEQAYEQIRQSLSAPGSFEQQAPEYRGQLDAPGAATQYNGTAGGQLQAPGSFEQRAGEYQAMLMQPGDANAYYASTTGQLQQPGQLERNSSGYDQRLAGPGNAQQAYQSMAGSYQAPTALEQSYGGLMSQYGQRGLAQQAAPGMAQSLQGGQVQDIYGKQSAQLDQPGQLEKFAASDAAGSNPYFDQLRQTTSAALDQEYNAGGNFNSGARMAALAKADSNLAAQQYQQEAALQGQAQQATQSRLGAQAGLAGQASGEQLGRTQAQSSLLSGADQQQLSRLGAQAGLAGDVSGQSLNYLNSGINAAQGVDTSNLARLQAQAGIDQNAQAGQLARLGLGGQLAQDSQQNTYQQMLGAAGVGQNAQQAEMARLGLGGQLAQNAGQEQYQRLMGGAGLLGQEQAAQQGRLGMIGQYGNDAQTQQLARLGLGGQLAQQATGAGFQQYNDYLNQAMNAQNASQGRQQQMFTDAALLGGQRSGLQMGAAQSGNNAYAQMVSAALGAQTNALSAQAQANANQQNQVGKLVGGVLGFL